MPSHTPSPPRYRGEAVFWEQLASFEDGNLHFWFGITPMRGTEIDVLLLDLSACAYCIEIKAIPISEVRHIDLQSLARKDGSVGPSPFGQSIAAVRALGVLLDKSWDDRPNLVPIAAFPLISRSEWNEKFIDGIPAEFASRCILSDDLVDVVAFRERLSQIARNPVGGRIRRSGLPLLKASDLDQMQTVLREAGALPNEDPTVASASTPVPVALLNEVVSLVTGPGAAYGAPGADSLTKWRYALLDSNARLRVSVVGEFKAGKSSLINAIFGRDVCFVDEFEATTISATYSSGSEEVVTLFGEEGASDQWPLPTFLEHCAKRELDGVQKVVVTLPTDIPFDITDTPGLGSFTAGHENEAEEQIRRTDLLLWAVDCNDAGSARESAFIERARQIGLPVKVLLTKADVLSAGELDQLIAYFVSETGIPSDDVIAVSSLNYRSGNDSGMAALIERLRTAASERVAYQTASYNAKLQEIVEGSRLALRYLLEVNAPNARFLAAERGYLESSAAGIARTGKFEWLRILREECAAVTGSLEIHSVADVKVVEIVLSQALPEAVEKATAKFLSSLRKLVRDEWRGALEERSREFERRLAELMSTRPDAKADLDFLRTQRDEFRARAEVIGAESSVPSVDNRIWVMGLGAAASVLAVSFVPLAVAGVVAGFAMLDPKARGGLGPKADPLISARIEDALVSSFEDVAEAVEVAIDRIVAEVAIRSLIKLVNRRGGPDYHTVLVIEHKASDLMDEISAVQ